ncbi:RNase H domain-containing protein [Aphis craccivora]|uniref:RNase H domain-containing protein n=1 Tax=Aphis craccivora TaxID=307492 RepID=A0A6G0YVQ3_APHCR|nr:RNase H domain-containing protein [Aphis craccivora]
MAVTLERSRHKTKSDKKNNIQMENHNFNRKKETTINRLRIGHPRLTHEYLVSKEEPLTCEECGTPLTIKHILTECQLYQQERINLNITLDSLLGPDPAQNRKILNFLKSINLIDLI